MIRGSRRPGPARTSCLTCRRRHKKCDLRQPVCERCERGDFECLGFGHTQDDPPVAATTRPPRRILPKPTERETTSPQSASSGLPSSETSSSYSSPPGEQSKDVVSTTLLPGLFASSHSNTSTKSTMVALSPIFVIQRIADLCTQLPYPVPDLLKTLDSQWSVDAIVARLETMSARWYFQPTEHQMNQFRQVAVQRLRNSKFARWISVLSMHVLESFLTGDVSQNQVHNTWIEYIEGSLQRELTLDLTPRQTRNRWSAWVHISLMKSRFVHHSNTNQLLRNITPTFLQVVYSSPTLWSNGCDPTRIPLSNILHSESHELTIFTLLDCTYAMVSGLPQRVDYDTTMYPQPKCTTSKQWVHSAPVEFQLVLADINACRDKAPGARDGEDIERWLLNWESQSGEHVFTESWMTIAWYAVRESWRLALLVYLYLAVCDASSDEPRVQSCVKQILQVIGTVKKRGPPYLNVSFFSQYLMAGICACSESHRKLVWDKLTSDEMSKLGLMRASDYTPILDYLWHNAGAGGRAIKWGDYVRSRETILPLL